MFFCLSSENGSETCSSWKRTSWEVLLWATGDQAVPVHSGPPQPCDHQRASVCARGVDVRGTRGEGSTPGRGFQLVSAPRHPALHPGMRSVLHPRPGCIDQPRISAARLCGAAYFTSFPQASVASCLQRLGFLPFVPCTVLWEGTGWNVGRVQRVTANE